MSYLWKGEVVELPPDTEVGVTQAQARGHIGRGTINAIYLPRGRA